MAISSNQALTAKSAPFYIWYAAIVMGLIYWAGSLARSGIAFDQFAEWPKAFVVALKCIATGLLVAAAWISGRTPVHRQLAISLAVIWLADLFLALRWVILSGFIFVLAHGIAASAYLKLQSLEKRRFPMLAFASSIPIVGMGAHIYVTSDLDVSALMLVFPLFSLLAAMLAMLSKFPFWTVGLGAVIFTLSDIAGVVAVNSADGHLIGWLTWLSYFSGLALVVWGLMTFVDVEG